MGGPRRPALFGERDAFAGLLSVAGSPRYELGLHSLIVSCIYNLVSHIFRGKPQGRSLRIDLRCSEDCDPDLPR